MKKYKFTPSDEILEYWLDALDKAKAVSRFYSFWKKIPGGDKVRPATAKKLMTFNKSDIQLWVDGFGQSNAPEKGATISGKMDNIMFNIDAKGVGKGEIMWAWKTMAQVQGQGESFDLQIGSIKYEVQDYAGSSGAIRAGVEASVSKFPFWDQILATVKVIQKIDNKKAWDLIPDDIPLKAEILKIKDYILTRVAEEIKIVTGEFNKKDVKNYKDFYTIANKLLSVTDTGFNQVIFKGPNQKPVSFRIDPTTSKDLPTGKSGSITITTSDVAGGVSLETLTNYLNELTYVRSPKQWEKDLTAAVDEIIIGGPAKFWMVFRGKATSPNMKIIPKAKGNFTFHSISQNGVKFKELMP